jgi:hypothetical protein
MTAQPNQTPQTAIVYLTVNQFCEKHTAFTRGGMRALIFNEHQNGVNKAGAIVRLGRKVLVHEAKFLNWVAAQSGKAA